MYSKCEAGATPLAASSKRLAPNSGKVNLAFWFSQPPGNVLEPGLIELGAPLCDCMWSACTGPPWARVGRTSPNEPPDPAFGPQPPSLPRLGCAPQNASKMGLQSVKNVVFQVTRLKTLECATHVFSACSEAHVGWFDTPYVPDTLGFERFWDQQEGKGASHVYFAN